MLEKPHFLFITVNNFLLTQEKIIIPFLYSSNPLAVFFFNVFFYYFIFYLSSIVVSFVFLFVRE
jgi:hypothetical protein